MFAPTTLTGKYVVLRPLCFDDIHDIAQAGRDDAEVWNNVFYGQMHGILSTQDDFYQYVESMLTTDAAKNEQTFAVVRRSNHRVVGITRYMTTHKAHRWLEIGGTWYGRDSRNTMVNPESKFLMLRYAFEELKCVRVQFVADVRNVRSQKAIEKLGAVREGIIRDHRVLPNGYRRSSVQFSIIESEWQTVRAGLIARLGNEYDAFLSAQHHYSVGTEGYDAAPTINLQYGAHRLSATVKP